MHIFVPQSPKYYSIHFNMQKRKIILATGAALSVLALVIWLGGGSTKPVEVMYAEVKQGDFEISVTNTGELQAKNSELINAPAELRTAQGIRLDAIKIQDLVPEGTIVDSGDYVATLDRTQALNALRDLDDIILSEEVDLQRAILDTTMSLRNLRDQIKNLEYDVEEKKLQYEQSIYEPPASQRQSQISMEKAIRALEQAKKNYVLEQKKAEGVVIDNEVNLNRQVRRKNSLVEIMDQFEILAPKKGMVIYKKEWGGTKRKVGSSVSPWDLTVATLPDLSIMNSITYVNEIDISRVSAGQKVRIGIDAFPEKKATGVVTSVANIGEQLPNADAKVFEVEIQVDGDDPILRPSMTTSNTIIIDKLSNQTYLPLEAIFGIDSIPVVYTQSGRKQVVVLGASNENEVVVEQGVKPGEWVMLTPPDDAESMRLVGEELIPIIQEKRAAAKRALEELEKRNAERMLEAARKESEANRRGEGKQMEALSISGDRQPE